MILKVSLRGLFIAISCLALAFSAAAYTYRMYLFNYVDYYLVIDSNPQGVSVWSDGIRLGETPLQLKFPESIARTSYSNNRGRDYFSIRSDGNSVEIFHNGCGWKRRYEFRSEENMDSIYNSHESESNELTLLSFGGSSRRLQLTVGRVETGRNSRESLPTDRALPRE